MAEAQVTQPQIFLVMCVHIGNDLVHPLQVLVLAGLSGRARRLEIPGQFFKQTVRKGLVVIQGGVILGGIPFDDQCDERAQIVKTVLVLAFAGVTGKVKLIRLFPGEIELMHIQLQTQQQAAVTAAQLMDLVAVDQQDVPILQETATPLDLHGQMSLQNEE